MIEFKKWYTFDITTDEVKNSMEIDYDKLEEAIVKAYKTIEESKRKPGGWRYAAMKACNALVSLAGIAASIWSCVYLWRNFSEAFAFDWSELMLHIIFVLLISTISISCAIEAWKDSDEDAITHFNTNVALVALIVALLVWFGSGCGC